MTSHIPAHFIPIFTRLPHVAEKIMNCLSGFQDIENLCLAGGVQVRKIIFKNQKHLRNEKTSNILNKILIEQVFKKDALTLGNVF